MMYSRLLASALLLTCLHAAAAPGQGPGAAAKEQRLDGGGPAVSSQATLHPAPSDSVTEGSVLLENGTAVAFQAVAGFLTVGSSDDQDARLGFDGGYLPGAASNLPAKPAEQPATARMFYTAYFAQGVPTETRPILFFYDGGPGSSSMPLLLASFGPVRVVLPVPQQHPAGGPYRLENNGDCLLDVADLVIIDAPGTGYSRIQGVDAPAKFYGIDQDADAFARFIQRFLSKYERWRSPKYLFGHSYGTMRNAALGLKLLGEGISLNGMVSVSQFLSNDDFLDCADAIPGTENGYFLALPSYAAAAWFHHKVPSAPPAPLEPWLHEVERYALGEYASALLAGADLTPEAKQVVAAKLEGYTGIPAATWVRANLRLKGSEFQQLLQQEAGLTTGRLDTRYEGLAINPLATEATYDPSGAGHGSALVAAMNSYAHETLRFGAELTYEPDADVPGLKWDTFHVTTAKKWLGVANVLPDLAKTLIFNPQMHVLLVSGYFDLSTTYFAAVYEMKHLPMPETLQRNIEYQFCPTGHEPYLDGETRHRMHERIVQFIRASQNQP